MARERKTGEQTEAKNQGRKRRKRGARDDDAEAVEEQEEARALVDNVGQGNEEDEPDPAERGHAGADRRAGWAAVARRRAAHFAHYGNADDEAEEVNLHTGGNEARTLGPWSSARQLVEGRAAAAAAREDKIKAAAQAAAEAEAEARWEPRSDCAAAAPPPAKRVGKLYSMCLSLLVEYIDDVETLWGLPTIIKVQLAAAVANARRMTPAVLRLFTEDSSDEVVLPECSQLDPQTLADAMKACASPRLERLELGLCGRGFSDVAAAALAKGGPLTRLRSLKLGGAYRLTDADLEKLLAAAPNLEEIHLPQCSRLQDASTLPLSAPALRIVDLTECRGISAASLQQSLTSLKSLEILYLDGNSEVNDDLLTEVSLGCPLRTLSICNCSGVTDRGVRGVAVGAPQLAVLLADDVGRITDGALLALSESCKDIQVVSLRRCTKVTDVGIAALSLSGKLRSLNISGIPNMGHAAIKALSTSCRESLEELDVSWCRKIPEAWLGVLADGCTNLHRLTMFGCTQVTPKFLNGHGKAELEIIGSSCQKSPPPSAARMVLLPEA